MLPSSRAPIVTQVLVYKVGSADEVFGKTGVAHFLEHMMFKGTATVAPTEFSRTVSQNGGRDNAYTTYDSTGYYQTVAPDRLELVMRMEADRMANLRITEKELIPERQVVLEERRMRTDNSPSRAARRGGAGAAVRPAQALRHADQRLCRRRQEAQRRRPRWRSIAKFYAPNNAILIVAGDTTAEQVRKLAEKHYGPIAVRKVEPRRRPAQGAPDLPQRVIRADARVAEPRWSRITWRRPTARARASTPMRCRCWRACWAAARPAACGAPWWSTASSPSRPGPSYSPTSLGLTTFDLGVHPAPTTPDGGGRERGRRPAAAS